MVAPAVQVSGPRWGATGAAPLLLQRGDDAFVEAILRELATRDGRRSLLGTRASARDDDGTLRLFRPIHRRFHVALLEARCRHWSDPRLNPRLDPGRVDGAGLVVRRISVDPETGEERLEGWMRGGDRILRGWVRLTGPSLRDQDPDPDRRRAPPGLPGLELLGPALERVGAPQALEEASTPLFVAPPEVCREAGCTLLFGLVPVTSQERSEVEREPPAVEPSTVQALLPALLQEGGARTLRPRSRTLTAANADAPDLEGLLATLRVLSVGLDAFGDSQESRALLNAINRIELEFDDGETGPAGDELERGVRALLNREASVSFRTPVEWPPVSASVADEIARATRERLEARMARVVPAQGRYDGPPRRFRARAFVRAKRDDGCPPDLVWSEYTEPFRIVPWYESSDAPPVRVDLPDASLSSLKKLRPNVSFAMPEDLFNRINGAKLDALSEGKKPSGGPTLGLQWICSFSIPIITLCAFIVLNIFLQLLNIIFWWLPLVKICLPVPAVDAEEGA